MAHMSAREKAQAKMKKLRKRANPTQEEIEAKEAHHNEKPLNEEVNLMVYDYQHRQLSRLKYPYFTEKIKDRIGELKVDLITINPELEEEEKERVAQRIKNEINKLEGIKNELNI